VPLTGFDPVADTRARLLILGSMPGLRSLAAGQYYAGPRNRFWPLMGEHLGFDPAIAYGRRLSKLTDAGIALWDVLRSCEREGSLDASIVESTEVPNDFTAFLERHSHLRAIAFNGQKAAKSFEKRVALSSPLRDRLDFLRLPSTSAANARYSHAALVEEWGALLRFLDHRDRSPTSCSP